MFLFLDTDPIKQMNKASFINMHSLDFTHCHMLKMEIKAKRFSEMTSCSPWAKE
jgi:hypothetical protein